MGPANGRKSVREATPDPEAEEDPVASTSQCQSHGEGTTPRQAGGDSERLQGYQYDEIHEDSHSDDDDGRPGQDVKGKEGPLAGTDSVDVALVDQITADSQSVQRASRHALLSTPPRAILSSEQARALERAKDRIGKDKYDLKGWKDLVRVISGLGTAAEALAAKRALYQEVVEVFPTAGEIWARLVEVEVSAGNFEAAKGLFAKCMAQCPSIELYKWYLNVVQEISKARGADGQVQVKKALEHTCEQLGQGPESGELWERYIAFLRGLVPGTDEHRKVFPVPGQEEARQKEVLRKAYHQALSVPHDRLDDLWRGYERFEQEACASADMAKKMVDELLPTVNLCRVVYAERRKLYDGVPLDGMAVAPSRADMGMMQRWKAILDWERSNKQNLNAEQLIARTRLAYNMAVAQFYRNPDMWYSYVAWHMHGGGQGDEEALKILSRAQVACPGKGDGSVYIEHISASIREGQQGKNLHIAALDAGCLMLGLLRTEILEKMGALDKAKEAFEALLGDLKQAPTGAVGPAGIRGAVGADMASGAMTSEGLGEVFIQYMHFMRRHDGILAARRLFAERAVKGWEGCPWTVYAAAALMDWNHDRNGKAVRNIFEFGAKKFIGDPGYVQEYVSWLLAQGDDVNARNLAERALTSCEPLALRAMWDVRMGLEAELGNSSEMWRLEARRRETLGQLADHDKELDQYACLVMRHYRFAVWPGTASERLHFREAIGLAPKWAKGRGVGDAPGAARQQARGGGAASFTFKGALKQLMDLLPQGTDYSGAICDPSAVTEALLSAAVPQRPQRGPRKRENEALGQGEDRRQRQRH